MGWAMTRAEKREEKLLNRQFSLKYGKKKTKHSKNKAKRRFGVKKNLLSKWRKAVLEREDYTCQDCGRRDSLHAHHIKAKSEYPKLCYKVSNGQTLCENCHDNVHGGLVSYYKQQSFIRKIVGLF